MENAYYYFFSATSQVLAGVMALFGVFVLFKLQSLVPELLLIGNATKEYLNNHSEKNETIESLENRNNAMPDITNALLTKNIKELKKALDKITIFNAQPFLTNKTKFESVYSKYQDIITRTILATTFTGIIIIICLALLPFAKFLSCHPVIVFNLFALTIIFISIVFYLLITIIKKSLQ